MELKRYVMLNNNVIYDMTNDYDVKKYEMVKNASALRYQLKKTSDNILDLVEVGDLVSDGTFPMYVGDKDDNDFIDYTERVYMSICDVKYIYKLQPNGDYKKYEVVEND
jgi:hypothetical protein